MRFEKGSAFVELEAQGEQLIRHWGRIGGEVRERVERHETARIALMAQVHRLEARGYRPGRSEPNLLRAIQAEPANAAPYLVYADWLLAEEDPRGELIITMFRSGDCEPLLLQHEVQLRPRWMMKFELEWRLGFIRKATGPARDCWQVRRLLRHPSALALEELVLQGDPWREQEDWLEVFASRPPTLRRIEVERVSSLSRVLDRVPGLVGSSG